MSFSNSPGMGPRGALHSFGKEKEGRAFDWRITKRLLLFLRPFKREMGLAFLLMMMATGLTLLIPYLMKQLIDVHIGGKDLEGLNKSALLLGLAYVALYLADRGERWLLGRVGQQLLANMRLRLFRHLQELSLSYYDTHIIGVTVSRVINDVAVINELLSQGLMTLIGDLLILVGIIVVMVGMSAKLALYTFAVLPLMILATWLFSRKAQDAFRDTRRTIAQLVGRLAEQLSGMRVIQAFAQEEKAAVQFQEANEANKVANVAAISLSFIFLPTVEILGMGAMIIVLWFGGLMVYEGEVTVGVLVAFLAYVSRFFQPIQELSRLYTTLQSAMAGGEQIFGLLDTKPLVADLPQAREMPPIKGAIKFEKLSFRYGLDGPLVLKEIDLQIKAGQTVALVGETGAGKSSIANLVSRFYDVSEGRLLIDGIDVRQVGQRSLRRQMGLVAQDPFLFPGTIGENIRFGRPEATDVDMEAAAELANARQFIEQLPLRYETVILEGGVNLSVGQRQLLCIARAVLANPRILIMDEATANVDTVTEGLIQEAVGRLLEDRTALVIAHRLSTIRDADLICVVDGGRIVEQGTHEQLLEHGGRYARLYQIQGIEQ